MHQDRQSSFKLQVAYLLVAMFAVLNFMPVDFPYIHTHDHPVYDSDDHDVCRAAGWTFAITMAWYFSMMISLLRNKHATEQSWGQRLLIYPNIVIGIVGMLGCIAVYRSFWNHSEEGFIQWMGWLNGSVLTVITVYCITIVQHPLAEGLRYAWSILFFTTGPFLLLLMALAFFEGQFIVAGLTVLILIPFLWGILELKSWATKEPYKF